jgi:ABC-type Fe3+/spermidine/putrescine transport system ATPase subunit
VSRYAADFIGETNLLSGTVVRGGSGPVTLKDGDCLLNGWSESGLEAGTTAWLSVRPEAIDLLTGESTRENVLEGTVAEVVYLGSQAKIHLNWGQSRRLVFQAPATTRVQPGTPLRVGWSTQQARCLAE